MKTHHLPDRKPARLFYEFILHEGFGRGAVAGPAWADLTASALAYVAARLRSASSEPVRDPGLGAAYEPTPVPDDLDAAIAVFDRLARDAAAALAADRCPAGALWREVFGRNGNPEHDWVFPIPAGCTAEGAEIRVGAAARNPLRGSNEARGFGA